MPPFANSSQPAIKSLGQASVTGKAAIDAAAPRAAARSNADLGTVHDLQQFAGPSNCSGSTAPPSWPRTWRSSCTTSTTAHAQSSRTRGAPAARGTPGWRRCSSTCSTRCWRSTTSRPSVTALALDLQLSPSARPTPRRRHGRPTAQDLRGRPTASATTGSGPNQPGVNETDPSNPTRVRARSGRRAADMRLPARTQPRLFHASWRR